MKNSPQIDTAENITQICTNISTSKLTWAWVKSLPEFQNTKTVFKPLPQLPSFCKVLTFDGLSDIGGQFDTGLAFGGDPRAQMIGKTIYALAHEFGFEGAIDMFVDGLMPGLFGEEVGISVCYVFLFKNMVPLSHILYRLEKKFIADYLNMRKQFSSNMPFKVIPNCL